MGKEASVDEEIEYTTVSDIDIKPLACIECGHDDLKRLSYRFVDRQDLGTPRLKRVQRHDKVQFECKHCGARFTLGNPKVNFDSRYTRDVQEYVFKRVLERGDSMGRVAKDLKELHNVDITVQGIHEWIVKKRGEAETAPGKDIAGGPGLAGVKMLTIDGTFKAVAPKKNDPGGGEAGHSWLHLTRSKDGRLVAIWRQESEPRKRSRS